MAIPIAIRLPDGIIAAASAADFSLDLYMSLGSIVAIPDLGLVKDVSPRGQ